MRLPRSLHWRIALAYTALIFVTMGVVSIYLVGFVRNTYIANLQAALLQQARLVSETTAPYLTAAASSDAAVSVNLQALTTRLGESVGARATLIGADGSVIADSMQPPAQTPSQLSRPEVRRALDGSAAYAVYDAAAPNAAAPVSTIHAAAPIVIDGVVVGVARISAPVSQVQPNINRLVAAIALSALIVAMLSVGIGYILFRRTARSVRDVADGARRLAQGDLEHRVAPTASDETQELAEAFNTMAHTIRRMLRDMSAESGKLTAMLDTMEDGVVVIEADGAITLLNSAAELMLDIGARDAVGARLVEVLRDHEIQQTASLALSSGRIQQAEVEILPQRRFLKAIATPLSGASGAGSAGILLTLHDLSGVRQVETTLREFVTNVSHELRSPLASVKAMVETLQEGALEHPHTARNFLDRINRDVDRMNDMVEDLLELSRLESGRQQPNLAPLDMSALVAEVVAEYADRAPGVDVRAQLPAAAALALGESAQLRQALVNLLENALKNTPSGNVTVSVVCCESRCCVRVSDSGVGIPREHLPHVFERFYKVDRARRDGGSGLGLAIVQHIIQMHGGEVGVESEEGAGSVFTFSVPRIS